MNLYFDNAASVCPSEQVLKRFAVLARENFANQESSGADGVRVAGKIEKASARLAEAFAPGADVFWTGTGTDALSIAVRAFASLHPGGRVLTTEAEHPALSTALERAAKDFSWKIDYLKLLPDGGIDIPFMERQLDSSVVLLAVHHVNAETGRIQNLSALRKTLDLAQVRAAFLADTTQSAGKIPIPWDEAHLDFATLSGCKIGSPGGAALMFRPSPDRKMRRALEKIRSVEHGTGRCPPAFALLISELAASLAENMDLRARHVRELKTELLRLIGISAGKHMMESVPFALASPYILHLVFPDWQGAILVRALHAYGVSAASGSACMSETPEPSHTLRAMGYAPKLSFGAFRLSFWDDSDEDGVKHFAKVFDSVLKNY